MSAVLVLARHAQPPDGIAVEVKLNDDGLFLAHNPAVMSGLDGHHLRRLELPLAAIGVSI